MAWVDGQIDTYFALSEEAKTYTSNLIETIYEAFLQFGKCTWKLGLVHGSESGCASLVPKNPLNSVVIHMVDLPLIYRPKKSKKFR